MNKHHRTGRYFCERCLRRYEQPGDCPRCEYEPLLDLEDEEVRHFLEEADARARTRRFARCFGLALIPGILIIYVSWFGLRLGMIESIVGGAFVVFGIATLLARIFRVQTRAPIYKNNGNRGTDTRN